jgi:hypothetical protein
MIFEKTRLSFSRWAHLHTFPSAEVPFFRKNIDFQLSTLSSAFDLVQAGAGFIFSYLYTKKEHAAQISILCSACQMAGGFGGLRASAITLEMDEKGNFAVWRWMCMLESSST